MDAIRDGQSCGSSWERGQAAMMEPVPQTLNVKLSDEGNYAAKGLEAIV